MPPGQIATEKFPVMTYGETPQITTDTWSLRIDGAVRRVVRLDWDGLQRMTPAQVTADLHCVTGWSLLNNVWEGVFLRDLLAIAGPLPGARFALIRCDGGYTTSLLLEALLDSRTLIAFDHDGEKLTPEHGGPVRLVVPSRYGYKSAKWIAGVTLRTIEEHGFWELHGYHANGDPWTEQRESP
ncbi:MAG: molybdopterin-dependent oxidoreductase [Chloroflexi bacterium]|nr:molybdopterin-dependent oxidoreductase [Chloroflexota bacterium]